MKYLYIPDSQDCPNFTKSSNPFEIRVRFANYARLNEIKLVLRKMCHKQGHDCKSLEHRKVRDESWTPVERDQVVEAVTGFGDNTKETDKSCSDDDQNCAWRSMNAREST